MVDKFKLLRNPKLLFGEGQLNSLPDIIKGRFRNILLITGSKSFHQYKSIQKLIEVIKNENLALYLDRAENEPSPNDIDCIAEKYRNANIDIVVAIGGGSALDTGKAVSAMLPMDDSVKNYMEGVGNKIHSGKKVFFVAVPTTSGTGSEAASNAVLSDVGVNGYKRSLRHDNFIPDISIVDPLLTVGCPPDVTSQSGMDAFTQLVESYTSTKANSYTDLIAFEGISRIKASLLTAVSDSDNIAARSDMSYAAFLSGVTMANAGLGLIHGYASAIGGLFVVPHGVVCGTLMAIVNRFNIEKLSNISDNSPAHLKYSALGKLFSGVENKNLRWYMSYFADYLDDLTERLQIRRLGEYGITNQDADRILKLTDHKSNPVTLDASQLKDILIKRI